MTPLPGFGPGSRFARWFGRGGGAPAAPGRGRPRLRFATYGASLAVGIAIIGVVFAAQLSSTPQFCGTCHIMKPYYQSWKHSKHNRIACVDCHISPGITAEIRKKYEALSMVVKYFTATYGTNPWAEVDDAACLRCHERRLLEGQEEFHGVVFDHTPHLTESRRGLHLRCTSCHSQIVQGAHIAVTSSTCALCHFKNQPMNTGTGRCRLCHHVPEQVVNPAGVAFDHGQVARLDMPCGACHASVVRGDGAVPRERCLTCHNQADRLARIGERDFLHRMHVTTHKVDCMNCHLQIEHGQVAHPGQELTAAAGACESCHGSGHSPQRDLFAGIGGRGVPRTPSPMFLAGVTCQGCHNPDLVAVPASTDNAGPSIVRAGAVSCMSCHGPGYRRIYEAWQAGVAERTSSLRRQLEATVASMGLSPPQAWLDAKHNFDLVERGKGVHNVHFAYALLDQAHEQMNQARRAAGLSALESPWPVFGAMSGRCLDCHQGIERQAGSFAGRAFAHRPHLTEAKLECATCHRPHQERAPGEVVRFGREGCLPCHHKAETLDAAECMKCHGDFTSGTVTSFRGEFSHALHLEQGLECATCHAAGAGDPRPAKAACQACHAEG